MKDTPIDVTWPFLKYICCCLLPKRKPNFKFALKRAIRRKLEMKVPKSDIEIEANPFLQLGYGMNSYLDIIVELMCMAALCSIVSVPLMMAFSSFSALEKLPGYSMNMYTLGNIGGADAFCAQSKFNTALSALSIECPNETLIAALDTEAANKDGKPVFEVGIIPTT